MKPFVIGIKKWLNRGQPAKKDGDLNELKYRYSEFKYLLRANNDVLSLIAEIESRLTAGDVLGTHYLLPRYAAASAKVYKMILHLNRISGGAYPKLSTAFERIRLEIEKAIENARRPEDDAYVLALNDVNDSLLDLTGAKAANLAAVNRFGLKGRRGFVITAAAFRRLMDACGLKEYINHELTFLEDPSYADLAELADRIKRKMTAMAPPEDLANAIEKAAAELSGQSGLLSRFSVRSSALGEDADSSFAGQYKTILNVPFDNVVSAYLEVAASLYEPQAMAYRRRRGFRNEDAEMAVLVLIMLRPESSGVMYTTDPRPGRENELLINSVFGLGRGLVDGEVTPDAYSLGRTGEPTLIHQATAVKKVRLIASESGVKSEPLPHEYGSKPALTREQAEELARMGLHLEKCFGEPQDIEWSYLPDEGFVILQSRPLHVSKAGAAQHPRMHEEGGFLYKGGDSARPGKAVGPVHFVFKEEDLATFPDGGILAAHKSSPIYSSVFDRAAAVITEVGGITGHMASLAREAGIPTIVGAQGLLSVLEQGREITVDADSCRIYNGRERSISDNELQSESSSTPRRQKPGTNPVARLITALTLTDPRSEIFRPERCQTFHDLIRFVHEMSFREMFRLGDHLGNSTAAVAKKFVPRLPFELWIIDIGGGLSIDSDSVPSVDEVKSIPGRFFLEGLLDQRVHWNQPRPVSLRGMMSIMSGAVFHPDAQGQERSFGDKAYAIMSSEYLNFNSRVGYHFAALDSVCGLTLNDNYISYRFKGGAAAEDRRIRRVEMIGKILTNAGFQVECKGDMISAFIKKYDCNETGRRLADLGRLTLFTRQMDMLMHDRRMADWLATAFQNGNFDLDSDFDIGRLK